MATALTEPAFWVLTGLAEEPRHGYALLRRIEELSDGASAIRVTTLYATLDRLERDGQIHVLSEEVVDGRARRTYAITDDGRATLAHETERLVARARAARASLGAPRLVWNRTAAWAPA